MSASSDSGPSRAPEGVRPGEVLLSNFEWFMTETRSADDFAALLLFAPLISKWVDAGRDLEPGLRKSMAQRFIEPYRRYADWEQIAEPAGGLAPLKQIYRRLLGIAKEPLLVGRSTPREATLPTEAK